MILVIGSAVLVLLWIGASFYLIIGSHKIPYLKKVAAPSAQALPAVAVVIAVKDEEAEVEEALRSVCGLAYPAFSITVINDRSTDGTESILQRMAAANPRIRVVTISELPSGWLGKNHALYKGYQLTSEEWLLFTDADVKYAPTALQKAMHYVAQQRLDHLTVLPEITATSRLFQAVVTTFALMLTMKLRPWQASNPSSSASVGVGAFNLVRRKAYEAAGTHSVISLRPDDDLKLGELMKKQGFRQGVLYGNQEIWLQWYTSLQQFVQGLMKNTFSVANYNVFLAIGFTLATLLFIVLPVPLLIFSGVPFLYAGLVILGGQILVMVLTKGIKGRWWYALLVPFTGMVMVYILARSTWLTIRQGGIYWRGSFYSLAELKKQA